MCDLYEAETRQLEKLILGWNKTEPKNLDEILHTISREKLTQPANPIQPKLDLAQKNLTSLFKACADRRKTDMERQDVFGNPTQPT
jgi:hypothetical protein